MFNVRLKFIAGIIFIMMSLVITRLAFMQILKADFYREEARRRQMRISFITAPRGPIFARDGETILAEDLPVRSVCVVINDLYGMPRERFENWFLKVASIAGDTPDGVAARVQSVLDDIENMIDRRRREILSRGAPGEERFAKQALREARDLRRAEYRRPQPLYEDVDFLTAARAEVATPDFAGLAVTESMKRRYPFGPLAAHAIGYVGQSTREEWDLYRFDYLGDERKRVGYVDVMGRAGMEKQCNFELRGLLGRREEVVNAYSQTQKVLSDEPPQPGATIILTIDPVIQEAAEKALATILTDSKEPRPGAAVCMHVKSGEILALASSPSYDPNRMKEDYRKLTDPNGLGRFHPFQDRAIASAKPMGSVFKVIVATAGLESGALTRNTTFTCDGVFHLGRSDFRCYISRAPYFSRHGPLDLIQGMKVSCNCYFYQAGLKTTGPALVEWALGYGLGKPTGIDLSPEAKGNVPTPHYPGDVVNLSIGQGELLATPLQVCRMIAAVANGGKLLTPRLRREMAPVEPQTVGFSASTWKILREGLYEAVNVQGGTGYRNVRSDLITIAGKSGTAQAPAEGDQVGDHAWFAGFAPYENPEIAFAVVIEHGGYGGAVAGPVAKAIAEAYAAEKGIAKKVASAKEPR